MAYTKEDLYEVSMLETLCNKETDKGTVYLDSHEREGQLLYCIFIQGRPHKWFINLAIAQAYYNNL